MPKQKTLLFSMIIWLIIIRYDLFLKLDYRREFSAADKKPSGGGGGGAVANPPKTNAVIDEAASKLLETKFSDCSGSSSSGGHQMYNTPHHFANTKLCYDVNSVSKSHTNSPYIEKKSSQKTLISSALTLTTNNTTPMGTPQLRPKAASQAMLPSPSGQGEEHQYDIPFSHIQKQQQQQRQLPPGHPAGGGGDSSPDYDEMEPPKLPKPQRKSHHSSSNSNRTSSNSDWRPALGDSSSLLQPRLIDGTTSALIKHHSHQHHLGHHLHHGQGKWSGSEKSLNTSIYSGMIVRANE